jgi:peptidoglycan/LPS O-acetylase OafA/YrhL
MAQLDGLRAIAVGLVLMYHFWRPVRVWVHSGAVGVRLFFVLSGFLITGILLKSRESLDLGEQSAGFALQRFYVRRFLRIFPLYYLALLIAWSGNVSGTQTGMAWHVSYLSNLYFFLQESLRGSLSHFWSLAVEEQFYLFWPWIILFTPRRRLPEVALGAIVTAVVFRLVVMWLTDNYLTSILPFSCLDSLGVGAYLAMAADPAFRSHRMVRQPTRTWAWAGVVLFIAHQGAEYLHVWSLFRIVAFDLAVALPAVWLVKRSSEGIDGLPGRILQSAPLRYVGTISYGVYAYHMMLPELFTNVARQIGYPGLLGLLGRQGIRYAIFYSGASVVIAAISWRWFEGPINRLKARFDYRQSPKSRDVMP